MYCKKKNLVPQLQHPDGLQNPNLPPVRHSESKLARNVVLKMVEGLRNVGHLVIMDNFFKCRITFGSFIYGYLCNKNS